MEGKPDHTLLFLAHKGLCTGALARVQAVVDLLPYAMTFWPLRCPPNT